MHRPESDLLTRLQQSGYPAPPFFPARDWSRALGLSPFTVSCALHPTAAGGIDGFILSLNMSNVCPDLYGAGTTYDFGGDQKVSKGQEMDGRMHMEKVKRVLWDERQSREDAR